MPLPQQLLDSLYNAQALLEDAQGTDAQAKNSAAAVQQAKTIADQDAATSLAAHQKANAAAAEILGALDRYFHGTEAVQEEVSGETPAEPKPERVAGATTGQTMRKSK